MKKSTGREIVNINIELRKYLKGAPGAKKIQKATGKSQDWVKSLKSGDIKATKDDLSAFQVLIDKTVNTKTQKERWTLNKEARELIWDLQNKGHRMAEFSRDIGRYTNWGNSMKLGLSSASKSDVEGLRAILNGKDIELPEVSKPNVKSNGGELDKLRAELLEAYRTINDLRKQLESQN